MENLAAYDQEKDAAFCFTCIKAVEQNLISSKNVEKAFISVGYKSWSDAGVQSDRMLTREYINDFTSSHNNVRTLEYKFPKLMLKRNRSVDKRC